MNDQPPEPPSDRPYDWASDPDNDDLEPEPDEITAQVTGNESDVPHPVNWRTLTAEDAEDEWLSLNEWVDWLRHEFGLPASVIPPYWHRHPELVWELSALHLHWLLVHAAGEQAARFYRRFGFEPSPTDPLHLLVLLEDVRAALREAPS